ncbi:hypothetical protein PVAP13_4NG152700 [Panicum virgatum]|uniref:Uncharacterized protein n=1 Tax=Panicum virgatum TaxID=38727 RepID=A0A8T0T283_PANVG|nr:hypothetical protein PVAP13_4NG152700 [Panicum virgatum]
MSRRASNLKPEAMACGRTQHAAGWWALAWHCECERHGWAFFWCCVWSSCFRFLLAAAKHDRNLWERLPRLGCCHWQVGLPSRCLPNPINLCTPSHHVDFAENLFSSSPIFQSAYASGENLPTCMSLFYVLNLLAESFFQSPTTFSQCYPNPF